MNDHPFTDADFRKSDRSGDYGCVEAAITHHTPNIIGLRDSVHPYQTVLCFSPREWTAFTAGLDEF
ncbi:DUF397 domain-containing protein [Thermobifida alba]|jgi:hypothetical protein|uniref:DUF397 domain-containing protein n=2 Tax=Thermobifida TaxID=83677 RepID=A0A147KF03_THECS|nr:MULTISPECIES: DUF397 domain-containing protein [Thermobifida]KUP95872.1 hypothetical protein AC529_15245 [Thermobifida cellulosilytica TB100]UPT20194.1 DUF397 domain-containing protein [Thermobifida alba]HLU95792.1 DUF397 domain-containing protein [Thermobifida alba]